jgi:uncharacterized membrane protein
MRLMSPAVRKFALTLHVTASVAWLGAVACFLALAVSGLTSEDAGQVRSAYLAMSLTTWVVIVPLSLLTPLTGLAMSLGTAWGVLRHYWVIAKLVITVPACALLLLHLRPIGHLAQVVSETSLARGELQGLRVQLVANAGAAVVALFVATLLSVYKPRGLTPHGRRQRETAPTRP